MATQVDIAETNISASQMLEFFRLAALQGHVNRQSFQAYLEKRNPFEDSCTAQAASTKFVIDILPNLTIAQMVELGKYNWANELVSKNFQADSTLVGKWECELLNPIGDRSSERALHLCNVDGWQGASVDHTLLFGATYPKVQLENWVVGLGSSCQWDGDRNVPVLYSGVGERWLSLDDWLGVWGSGCRFLRVRRLSA